MKVLSEIVALGMFPLGHMTARDAWSDRGCLCRKERERERESVCVCACVCLCVCVREFVRVLVTYTQPAYRKVLLLKLRSCDVDPCPNTMTPAPHER